MKKSLQKRFQKDTIEAYDAYELHKAKYRATGKPLADDMRILFDGDAPVMIAKMRSVEDFVDEEKQNECFALHEVFTTRKGNRFIYWSDTETGEYFLTKISD